MRRRLLRAAGAATRAAALATAAAALVGCGTTSGHRPLSGAALFSQDCSKCHSLIGNKSRHTQGGDLLGYDLSQDEWNLSARGGRS